jgi:hypothetical protein
MNSRLEKTALKILPPILRALRKNKIFITCTPKSASTYLMRLLADIINARATTFISAYDRTEQDISLFKVIETSIISTVTHQHMKCSDYNLKILSRFKIKPLILTRNIYDSIISMKNHIHKEPTVTWWPMAYIDESFYIKSAEKQIDFIIDFFVPWYINFYVSWHKECEKENFLWITYKELMEQKAETINKILQYYKLNITVTDEVIQKRKTRCR